VASARNTTPPIGGKRRDGELHDGRLQAGQASKRRASLLVSRIVVQSV
jgi:hypothetical protein